MSTPPVSSPEFEVLPAEKHAAGAPDSLARLAAYVMDNLVKIPGTQARVGINPLLDLGWVFGDSAAAVISAFTIIEGFRRRVPKVVLARMSVNILLNGLLGMIPGVGEVFSFWYKPTSRNYKLLEQHASIDGVARRSTWQEWAFVIGLLIVVLVLLGMFIGLGVYITFKLVHLLFGSLG